MDSGKIVVPTPHTLKKESRFWFIAPVGKRGHGTQDWHARGRTNAIGALIGKALLTVGLFNTNVNDDIFTAWLTQELIPKMPKKAVLVM